MGMPSSSMTGLPEFNPEKREFYASAVLFHRIILVVRER